MKNKTFIYIFIVISIVFLVSVSVVVAFNSNNSIDSKDNKELIKKTEDEIKFLEDKIIAIMNKLNNINFLNSFLIKEQVTARKEDSKESNSNTETSSETPQNSSNFSKENLENSSSNENTKYEVRDGRVLVNGLNNEIDWEYVKSNIEMIYSMWPTVIADLNVLDVKNEEILNFSNALDLLTISVKNEDKISTVNNLATLYTFLPIYRSQISKDLPNINIDYCKNCILNSYSRVEQNNWEETRKELNNAMNYYFSVMNSIDTNIQNQNRISKTYILLNELNNSTNLQDKEIYYLKYRNVMEELINL